jgi:SAM-dependent methyltransferase
VTEPDYLSEIRASYDTVAVPYADLLRDKLADLPLERAMLAAFADLAGDGPVLDAGCGPGQVTAYLRELGLDAFGIDLSPGMIEVAGRDYPDLRFEVGSMTALNLESGSLAGIVSWWSIVHLPTAAMPVVFAEFHRTLTPGGHLLVGFHAGNRTSRKTQGYGGHPMSLDVHQLPPDGIGIVAAEAGFVLKASLIHEPQSAQEVRGACLLFRKPVPA